MVNATPRPLYPRERPGTHCIGGWVGPRAGLDGCGKSPPTGIRSPDRPARSESLYRLRYPSPEIRCLSVNCNRVLLPCPVWGCGPYVEDIHGSRCVLAINIRPRQVTRVYFGGCIKTGGWLEGGGCLVNKFVWFFFLIFC